MATELYNYGKKKYLGFLSQETRQVSSLLVRREEESIQIKMANEPGRNNDNSVQLKLICGNHIDVCGTRDRQKYPGDIFNASTEGLGKLITAN